MESKLTAPFENLYSALQNDDHRKWTKGITTNILVAATNTLKHANAPYGDIIGPASRNY